MKNTKITYSFRPKSTPTMKVVREGKTIATTPLKFETPSETKVLEFVYQGK